MNDKMRMLWYAIQEKYERNIKPIYPRITVEVLGGEHKVGSIWLPDGAGTSKQNRPVYEGVVMDVYEPTIRIVSGKEVLFKPMVKVGDHIVFPHWSGDQKGLRHGDTRFIPEPEIIGIVDYVAKKNEKRVAKTTSGGKR